MTIIEAIKSGKAFKRCHWDNAAWLCVRNGYFWSLYESKHYDLDVNEVLANDWIVREE